MLSPSFCYRLAFILLLLGSAVLRAPTVQAGPYSALVVDTSTGKVLFEQNAEAQRYPASLTKMMTLYMTFTALKQGRLSLRQSLWVSSEAAAKPPSKLGLHAGDRITVEEAILGLVTCSANDAATVLAESLGGTEENFARQMTAQAHALDMSQSYFRNASGLPDPFQVTTAWDMFRLALALQRNFPEYYSYFSTDNFYFRNRMFPNHNHLLGSYVGADGLKTGYIRDSGYNLVASAQRNGTRLIGVVFGGETARSRDSHMSEILDMGFAQMGAGGAIWQTASRSYPSSSGTTYRYQPAGSYSISRVAAPAPVTYYGDRFDSAYPAGRSSETAVRPASTDPGAVVVDTRPKVTYSGPPTVTVAQVSPTDSGASTSGSIQPFQRYSSGSVVKETARSSEPYPTAGATAEDQDVSTSRRTPASWSANTAGNTRSTPTYSGTGSASGARGTSFYTYTGAGPASSTQGAPVYTYTGPGPTSSARSAPTYTGDSDRFKDNPAYEASAAEQESADERAETAPLPATSPTTRVTAVPTWRSGNSVSTEEGPGRYTPPTRAGTPLPTPTLIAQSKPALPVLQGDDDEASDAASKPLPAPATRVTPTPATSTSPQGTDARLPDAPPKPVPTLSPGAGVATPAGKGETSGSVELIGRPMYQEVTTESSTSQPELFPKAVPTQQKPAVAEKVTRETAQEQPASVSSGEDEEAVPAQSSKPVTTNKKPAPAEKAPATGKKAPAEKAEPTEVAAKATASDKKSSAADKIAKAGKPEPANPPAKSPSAEKKLASQDKAAETRKAEAPETMAKSKPVDKLAQSKATTPDKSKPETLKVAAVALAAPAVKPGLCQVQVGAFSSKADAAKQLVQASQAAPALLSPGRAVVTPVDRDGKTLYRACFKGLSQVEAGNACQTLKRKQMGCFLQQGS
ncbi:MAG: serine hydrolase [Candidatus Competibacteraceae bacterium]